MRLAEDISIRLKGGEVFALVGDLGCGKTTFVRGLARGLGCHTAVTSPTFNLIHRYRGGRLEIIHCDLYRLRSPRELEALDLESEMETGCVLAIEWPKLAESFLPQDRTRWIRFEERNENERQIRISPSFD